MGGNMMIRVESVRIVETNKKYSDIFHALFVLDLILSDAGINIFDKDFKITERDIDIIKELFIDNKILSFDEYIQMMVKAYIKNKQLITINMDGLDEIYGDNGKELVSFIIEDEIKYKKIKDIDFVNITSSDNLITSKIFDMFPSTTNINLNMGAIHGEYIFDLFMFLEIISKSDTWKIIKIKERVERWNENKSWLYLYYNSCLSSLESEYKKYGLKIQFKSIESDEYLIISRI